MKTKLIISLLILFASLTLYAQDEIVSIWLNDTTKIYTQPFNHANEIYWGPPVDITYGGGADDYGNGMNNTNDIVGQLGDNGGLPYAALICDTLTVGGFTDWYLPSTYELSNMVGKADSLGGGASFYSENTSFVWSSTEYNDSLAGCFKYGVEGGGVHKDSLANVRCIRREYSVGMGNFKSASPYEIRILGETNELYVKAYCEGKTTVKLFDIRGNQLLVHTLYILSGIYEEKLSLPNLIHGTYVVKFQTRQKVYTKKVVIN
jgi:hypothetical protein